MPNLVPPSTFRLVYRAVGSLHEAFDNLLVEAELVPESAGLVRGKSALRHYWTQALQRIPEFRCAVEGVYQGIDTIVIAYRNQDNKLVSEVLRFTGDVVIEGHATYLVS